MPPPLSLIIPTRRRPHQLSRFLDSLAETANDHFSFEAVLVVDEDDAESLAFRHPLCPRLVVGPPGRTMGALNRAGCFAARGEFVMLLNDDVVCRTPGWDEHLLAATRRFEDGIVLVHVNDVLMRENLCVFPLFPRRLSGLIHAGYRRYRIDDHIEDVFNVLAAVGERRTVYLPHVVFEHTNGTVMPWGVREYHACPALLAEDAPLFDALADERRRVALDLLTEIDQRRRAAQVAALPGAFALRTPGRQHGAPAQAPTLMSALVGLWKRLAG